MAQPDLAQPFFSVVIPSFNSAETIIRALDSLARQKFRDFEILVVDDGSTDSSAALVQAWTKGAAKLICQSNHGPSKTRNVAIHQAKGQYVCFLDSDDEYFDYTLCLISSALRKFRYPELLLGRHTYLNSADDCYPKDNSVSDFKLLSMTEIFRGEHSFLTTGGLIVRRTGLIELGGFRNPFNWEDHDLLYRLSDVGPVPVICEQPTYGIHSRKDSLSFDMALSIKGCQFVVGQHLNGSYPGGLEVKLARSEAIQGNLEWLAQNALMQNSFGVFLKAAIESTKLSARNGNLVWPIRLVARGLWRSFRGRVSIILRLIKKRNLDRLVERS